MCANVMEIKRMSMTDGITEKEVGQWIKESQDRAVAFAERMNKELGMEIFHVHVVEPKIRGYEAGQIFIDENI